MNTHNRRYEYAMVIMGFFAWGLMMFDRLSISFLLPVIQPDWNLTNTQIGAIGFVTSACYAISAIVLGTLADKLGHKKRWLFGCLIGAGLFTALAVISQNYNQLLFVRSLVGVPRGRLSLYSWHWSIKPQRNATSAATREF
jgi:putative MFS transporter